MGQQNVECRFYDNHFQPYIYDQNFISKCELSSHTKSLCLEEDILLLKQPTPLIFGSVNDTFIADQPLERHFEDIF